MVKTQVMNNLNPGDVFTTHENNIYIFDRYAGTYNGAVFLWTVNGKVLRTNQIKRVLGSKETKLLRILMYEAN